MDRHFNAAGGDAEDWLDTLLRQDAEAPSDPALVASVMARIDADLAGQAYAAARPGTAIDNLAAAGWLAAMVCSALLALPFLLSAGGQVFLHLLEDPFSGSAWGHAELWLGAGLFGMLVVAGFKAASLRLPDAGLSGHW